MSLLLQQKRPSLENLLTCEDLGLEILHPGGLALTLELAQLCQIEKDTLVLEVASGTGETACYLRSALGTPVVGIDLSESMVGESHLNLETPIQ